MPSQVRDLTSLVPTSSGSTVATAIGHLDDASSITIFVTSSANAASSFTLQISQFDPADSSGLLSGITESTNFFTYGATTTGGVVTFTSGASITIDKISFRGLRLSSLTSANGGEIIAFVSKQISV